MPDVLQLTGIEKTYTQGEAMLPVLRGVDVVVQAGEAVALMGRSGSGKSTLLHIAGLLDTPDKGRVVLMGEDITNASDAKRTELRRVSIGFVYQFHHLMADLTALENVSLPLLLRGVDRKQACAQAAAMLAQVGLSERFHHKPFKLSGGEQQRVAIARALVGTPKLLLADEPTGSLDADNSDAVLGILLSACKSNGAALLMATHSHELAARLERTQCL